MIYFINLFLPVGFLKFNFSCSFDHSKNESPLRVNRFVLCSLQVPHVVQVSSEVIKMGKCVVIGLQSTGEARTIEVVEREEELTDFVSTAKGVLQVCSRLRLSSCV